ncbi:MAG: asparaginase [Anaerofustis stercorihominis]|nr:asparaginase [Anaerofustis stercorihominis]
MKNILLIATGGTIASCESENGMAPGIDSQGILQSVPEIKDICHVDTCQLYNLDSTNMRYEHWIGIAETIKNNYDKYDGFVITHGTDTMAYTAAALSYLIQNNKKPIVLTGSQKSIFEKDSDARNNLIDAFVYANDEYSHLTHIVFDGAVIAATRARKVRTKSFNAFLSIDYPNVAVLRDHRLIHYITETVTEEYPTFYDKLEPRIFVLKLLPGLDASIFSYLKEHYEALIIESFGVGGVPCYGDESFISAIADWTQSGKTLVMTTQVTHEGSDMQRYEVGYVVKNNYDILEAYDMTLEAVIAKLMWILPQTKDAKEIRRLFYEPIMKDIL